jgi:hypothetical protein
VAHFSYHSLNSFRRCLSLSDGRAYDCMWLTPTDAEITQGGVSKAFFSEVFKIEQTTTT